MSQVARARATRFRSGYGSFDFPNGCLLHASPRLSFLAVSGGPRVPAFVVEVLAHDVVERRLGAQRERARAGRLDAGGLAAHDAGRAGQTEARITALEETRDALLLPALRVRQGLSLAGLGSLARYDRSYQPTQE